MSAKLSVSVSGSVPDPNWPSAIARTHRRVGRLGLAAARANFAKHTDTGETIKGLRSRVLPVGVEFYDPAPGGFFVEMGAKRHPIAPRNAKVLSWIEPGQGRVFRNFVKDHPGITADPWLKPAIEDHAETLLGVYGQAIESEWNRG